MNKPKIGDVFTHEFKFTNEQVLTFAQISGDTNPIHVDNLYGQNSEFKKCIVHGYFSISIFSKVYGTLLYPDGHILINQHAKYIKPIFSETKYLAIFTVLQIDFTKNRVTYKNEILEKDTNELKVVGEATLMNRIHYI